MLVTQNILWLCRSFSFTTWTYSAVLASKHFARWWVIVMSTFTMHAHLIHYVCVCAQNHKKLIKLTRCILWLSSKILQLLPAESGGLLPHGDLVVALAHVGKWILSENIMVSLLNAERSAHLAGKAAELPASPPVIQEECDMCVHPVHLFIETGIAGFVDLHFWCYFVFNYYCA